MGRPATIGDAYPAGGLVVRALALQGDPDAMGLPAGETWDLTWRDDGGPDSVSMAATLTSGCGADLCLGMAWADALRHQGQAVDILAFPARLVLRVPGDDGGLRIVDPCRGGATLSPPALRALLQESEGPAAALHPGLFDPLDDDEVLLRLLMEAKVRHLRQGELGQALAMVEGALGLEPGRARLWREAGLMRMRQGDLAGAVAALEQFVQRTDNGPARGRASQLLDQIRVRMR